MICEKCNLNQARINIVKIINGKKTSMNLCEQCAQLYENILIDNIGNKNVDDFIMSIYEAIYDPAHDYEHTLQCNVCGLTLEGFKNTGRLGCDNCYHTFRTQLDVVLEKVQGKNIHIGKIPKRTGGVIEIKKQILNLKKELNEKVEKEEFEEAATIRDEIKRLERTLPEVK